MGWTGWELEREHSMVRKDNTADMTTKLRIYEFLATPAHIWLWLCARLVGGKFKCGPVADPNDSLE